MELAFAGLQQLCAPLLDGALERLPVPQREALATAFGLRAGVPPDRFLVGLGVLNLLSEVCADEPLVCVIDDAQWLDRVSAQTLAFVARRVLAEPIALVFAVREPCEEDDLRGLPELMVEGLDAGDARALLASVLTGPLDAGVRERILDETHGNPLALLGAAARLVVRGAGGRVRAPGRRRASGSHRGQLRPALGAVAGGDAAAARVGGSGPGWRSRAGVAGRRTARDRGRRGRTGGRGRADRRRRAGPVPSPAGAVRGLPGRAADRAGARARRVGRGGGSRPGRRSAGLASRARDVRPRRGRGGRARAFGRPGAGARRARRGGRVLRACRRAHTGAAPASAPCARRGPGQAPGRCPGRGDPSAGAGARRPARRARQRPGGAVGGPDRVRRRPWSRGAAAVAEGRQAARSAGRRARPRDVPRRVRGGAVRGPARRWERCARGGRSGASSDLGRVGAAVATGVRTAAGRAGGPRDGRVRRGRPDVEARAARVPRRADVGGGRSAVAVARVPGRARPR